MPSGKFGLRSKVVEKFISTANYQENKNCILTLYACHHVQQGNMVEKFFYQQGLTMTQLRITIEMTQVS